MEHLGTKVLNYRLTRFIGEGGMASVYEGTHEKLGTKVAIKILNPILTSNKEIRQRFENEAKLMAKLNHINIVKVSDYDEQPQLLAIVMELLDGKTLDLFIKQKGELKPEEAIPIFIQIFDAFDYANSQKVVHRDIKPANIFIDENNKIKILDFGIAKILGTGEEFTNTGTQMGTPVYMSPEQVKADKSIDHRSDIYSLGVTLFYALSGKPPYDVNTLSNYDIYNKIVLEPISELDKYHEINKVIQKATAKARNERYQTAGEFKNDLLATIDNNKTIINKPEDTIINTGETLITNKEKTVITKKETPNPQINTDEDPIDIKLNIDPYIVIISAIVVIAIMIFFAIKSNQTKGLTAEEQKRIADSCSFALPEIYEPEQTLVTSQKEDKKEEPIVALGSFIDSRDKKTYKTVKIGEQIWLAENLNFSSGNSWCYDDNSSNCNKYGRLYDWETAKQVCPSGWHLPSGSEWTKLTDYLGGADGAGEKMKSTSGWKNNGNGTNSSGFAGLPSGYRYSGGSFDNIGSFGYWWSSAEGSTTRAWYRGLYYFYGKVYRNDANEQNGLSVRCVKD